MGGLLPLIPCPRLRAFRVFLRIVDGADTFVYQDRDTPSAVAWRLMDRHIFVVPS
jgi:hypothetical protein